MDKWTEHCKWRSTNANKYMKKMFSIFGHQGNMNQDYIEILLHPSQYVCQMGIRTIYIGKDSEGGPYSLLLNM
jgi:hypothetical protein